MSLQANAGLSSPGVELHGSGFIVTPEEAKVLGFWQSGRAWKSTSALTATVAITDRSRGVAGDSTSSGLTLKKSAIGFQVTNTFAHGENRTRFRTAAPAPQTLVIQASRAAISVPPLAGLSRYSPHSRPGNTVSFSSSKAAVLPDNMLIGRCFGRRLSTSACLSSRIHVVYALSPPRAPRLRQ